MKPCKLQFFDEKTKKEFEKIKDPELKKFLERAFCDIERNPFCGIQIPKKIIPKEYLKKFNIRNAWKYNLPGAWRLIYSIKGGEVYIVTMILEWLNHKEYEKRFKY